MLKLDLNHVVPQIPEALKAQQVAEAAHMSRLLSEEKNQVVASIVARLGTFAHNQTHLRSDSRAIQNGDVFVAYPFDPLSNSDQGARHDGRTYVKQAHEQGARAVLWHRDEQAPPELRLPIGLVAELNQYAGHIASAYYGYPSENMQTLAVTGTNGKTTCAQWLAQIFYQLDRPCAIMGTLGVGFPDAMTETGFTTPQAVEVHRYLHEMQHRGARAMVMEVSSHALIQGRVNGVVFEVALFTNLSRDHLDYHHTMEAYESAKAQLFAWPSLKAAVINTDDPVGVRLAELAAQNGIRVIGYGQTAQTRHCTDYLRVSDLDQTGALTQFEMHWAQGKDSLQDVASWPIQSDVVGEFNVMNMLGVLGVCLAAGLDLARCVTECRNLEAAPGRMQRFGGAEQPMVVVDFAHTPDALEKTLQALQPIAVQRGGRLMCLFGCGGDRDAGKRPLMAAVAQKNADYVCVTSDNPRTEAPERIIQDICEGFNDRHKVDVEIHRARAIEALIAGAMPKDIILVAGKGHEPYQDIMGVKHPYSDIEQVQLGLSQWTQHVLNDSSAVVMPKDEQGTQSAQSTNEANEVKTAVVTVPATAMSNEIKMTDSTKQTQHTTDKVTQDKLELSAQPTDAIDLMQAGAWVQATQIHGQAQFTRVSTDTRQLESDALFVALVGERFDAHDFLAQLEPGQVAAVMAERVPEGFNLPYILVADTRVALQNLAKNRRAQFQLPVAVVTGSNGKTTVKEMLASILHVAHGEGYLATRGNLNNDIGLPLSILRLGLVHRAAVIELGMNHPGETQQLAPIVQPTVAIINNAQREHQEFMQTVEAVAIEHADVIDSVIEGGSVVFPANDAYADIWRERAHARGLAIHDFCMNECESAAYSARYELGLYASTVQLMTPMGQCTTQINIPGVHNVHNALAACAAATAMGISIETVAQGLAQFVPAKGRLQTHKLNDDVLLIDDTYNANPDSVLAAIDVLANAAGKKVLVLGDMGEVGEDGALYHTEIGAYAQQRGIHLLLATGDMMRHAAQAFGAGAQHFNEVAGIADVVRAHLQTGPSTILVKGSRFMGMERVVHALLEGSDNNSQKDASNAT